MIDLVRDFLGSSASVQTVELTSAVLLIGFVLIVTSCLFGIVNIFFRG